MVRDMTTGSSAKQILLFCIPLMVGNIFQQFYNMVDSIVVGRFVGKAALSAVGSVSSLNFLVIGSVIGLCAGFSIPIAQSFGAGDYTKMRKFLANGIYLIIALGALLTTLTLLLSSSLLRFLNTPQDVFDNALQYIRIIFAGIFATILYNLLAGILRAVGDSKTPLYFLLISSAINIVLDLVFVIAFSWGVMGVAVATVIAQAVSGLLCLFYVRHNFPILRFSREEAAFDGKCCKRLLFTGLPMSLQFSITAIGSVMLQSCVNSLGSDIIAAVTIASKIQLMIMLPSEAIGLTMATFCGQNIGAKKLDRVSRGVRQAILMAFIYAAIAMALVFAFGGKMSLLFIDSKETAVIELVREFLNRCGVFYFALAIIFILRNALQGLGFSLQAMSAGIFELVARAIAGFGFVLRFGYTAVCYANVSAWVAADIFLIPAYFVLLRKLRKKLDSEPKAVSEDDPSTPAPLDTSVS